MIIAAFAGAGKTYLCDHVENSIDFVCMPYKYYLPKTDNDNLECEKLKADFSLEINPEYPSNYINKILENMDKYKYYVIPSDSRVLSGLKDRHIPYILCFPEDKAKKNTEKDSTKRKY